MALVLTGLQPTGLLHVGNYIGALMPVVALQAKHKTIVQIVDLHALTTSHNPKELARNTYQMAAGLIASGVDPEKSLLFVQSHIPYHTELQWYLNTITPLGILNRMTQFKEKKETADVIEAGLLNYPILQAADILLYKAQKVPVGEDQKQHLELSREIARRFNNLFGKTFPEPETILNEAAPRIMSLNDPAKKMSKSLHGSYIGLTDSDQEMTKKIKRAVTDVGAQDPNKMSPGVENLFRLLKSFSADKLYQKLLSDYKNGELRYSELKQELIQATINSLAPIRERILELEADKKRLDQYLQQGAEKAALIAKETIQEVKEKMGLLMIN